MGVQVDDLRRAYVQCRILATNSCISSKRNKIATTSQEALTGPKPIQKGEQGMPIFIII